MKGLYEHTYNCSENHHIRSEPDCRLACKTTVPDDGRPPYPVLDIGRVAFFPTHEQLRELWRVVGCWLDDQAAEETPELIQEWADKLQAEKVNATAF